MGCIKFPRIHMYWQSKFKFPLISNAMPRDRFYLLRVNLHFVDVLAADEELKKVNTFWKIQPLIDILRNRCLAISRENTLDFCVDEQMVPFTGRCSVRQFVPNKPRPVGLKNFLLCSSSGTVLDFELYQGQKNTTR